MTVFLCGFMGCGKSTIGKRVAKQLNKSLSDDTNDRGSNHVRRNAHIYQTDNSGSRVVCMQCRKNKVSRDSSTDSDIGGLTVTDLTDHYDIRVLTQDRTQSRSKGHTCLVIDLTLVNAVDTLLDRVLNRYDVYVRLGKLTESSIKCCGLT